MNRSVFIPAGTNSWSTDELRKLKEFAQAGKSLRDIALALRRTESAIRNKAGLQGISLRTVVAREGREVGA